jgi:histone-lysine N-methyltransferase SETD2
LAKGAAFEAAKADNMSLVVNNSGNKYNIVYMDCSRHLAYRNSRKKEKGERERVTLSRRCKCKVRISIRPFHLNKSKYVISVLYSTHNHPMAGSADIFPENRNLNENQIIHFQNLISSNLSNKQVSVVMKNAFPSINMSIQDVINLKNHITGEILGKKNGLENLVECIGRLNWKVQIRKTENDIISGFLFIPPSSELLIMMFGIVIIIDATYKTNNSEYPLVQGIGITSTWRSFNGFYCFLSSESEEDYLWMMKGIKTLLGPSFNPLVFSTDREIALINAIKAEYPSSSLILCICFFNFVSY